jgi:hypothetical protein
MTVKGAPFLEQAIAYGLAFTAETKCILIWVPE